MSKRIVILGGGESGAGAAILAKAKGMETFVSDLSTIKPKYKALLDKHGILWEEEKHTEEAILNADEVVKSPGIPDKAPIIKKLKEKNIPIISEIEFAGRYTNSKMICITGSNGKTTTAILTYYILKEAGLDIGLAGNVGNSLALQVAETPHDIYVIELSSFQLDNMYKFKADISILLNITPDHLDRYDYEMQNYVDSKFRILQNQTKEEAFIFWNDDPILDKETAKRNPQITLYPFSENYKNGVKGYSKDNQIILYTPNGELIIERSELSLKGTHNLYNSMAAALVAKLINISDDKIKTALSSFTGVEHRLEKVAIIDGVEYINDSKATNVNSCWYAMQSMTTPVVLILGGTDKGNDYTEIEELVKEKAAALIFLGVDNSKLHDFFDKKVRVIEDAHSMDEAVSIAHRIAKVGDTVLLSPCCASFDLFESYEDRGTQFKEYVGKLK
jgi:UDP-N-acetylmuramoylalanine--D-glutamate ligase